MFTCTYAQKSHTKSFVAALFLMAQHSKHHNILQQQNGWMNVEEAMPTLWHMAPFLHLQTQPGHVRSFSHLHPSGRMTIAWKDAPFLRFHGIRLGPPVYSHLNALNPITWTKPLDLLGMTGSESKDMNILWRRVLLCLPQYWTQCPNTGGSQKSSSYFFLPLPSFIGTWLTYNALCMHVCMCMCVF